MRINLSQNRVHWQLLVFHLFFGSGIARSEMDDSDIMVAVGGKEILFSPKRAASFEAHPPSYSMGISHPI